MILFVHHQAGYEGIDACGELIKKRDSRVEALDVSRVGQGLICVALLRTLLCIDLLTLVHLIVRTLSIRKIKCKDTRWSSVYWVKPPEECYELIILRSR